jgi:hypothetical protein
LPNNDAFRSSRGRLIAYLNHDDLWFPAHLERAVAFLEQSGADLVYTLMFTIDADGTAFLSGATSSGSYEPQAFLPASSWVLKRELLEEVGPWRPARRVYAVPSQEWLARAWRAGKKLRLMPHVTVVALPSGRRPGSYKQEGAREHAAIFGQMVDDPAFLERRLTEMALRHAEADPVFGTSLAIVPYLRRAAGNAVRRLLIAANRHPTPLMAFLRYGRRGGVIDRLRAVRGLPPLPRTGPAS